MKTTQTFPPSRLVTRALVLPVGTGAERLAARVCELSKRWLAGDAPVAVVEADSEEGATTALEHLAGQPLAQSLRERGMALARPSEAELWAVIDLTAAEQPNLSPDQAAEQLHRLVEMAWRRLRIQLGVHGLLLATPAEQMALKPWTETLSPLWEKRLYLAGPINQNHLCLAEEEWRERAALGLAALLWSRRPSHSAMGQTPTYRQTFYALGASVWTAPRAEMNQWLSLRFAQRTLERLLKGDSSPEPQHAPERMQAEAQMRGLLGHLSGPPIPLRWGDRRPGLTALASLPQSLVQVAERNRKQREAEAQQGRRRWLAVQMAKGEEERKESATAYLTPTEGWPRLSEYRVRLKTEREEMMVRLQLVQTELEMWGEWLEEAERAVQQAQAELAELCAYFPTPDLRGGLTVLTHPWRLGGWVWAYLRWLPQRAQQLLDGLSRQGEAHWQESNWHALRQFYLAQAQEHQLALDEADGLLKRLAEMEERMAARLAGMDETELTPWTREGLEKLYSSLLADGSLCALAFLSEHPLSEWLTGDAEDPLMRGYTPREMKKGLNADDAETTDIRGFNPHQSAQSAFYSSRQAESALLDWPEAWLFPLERWTGVDHLVEALPCPALSEWMTQAGESALPLWPDQAMESDVQGENRLLLGLWNRHPEGSDSGHGERLERLREAASELPSPVESSFHGDGVALLRLALVDWEVEEEGEA